MDPPTPEFKDPVVPESRGDQILRWAGILCAPLLAILILVVVLSWNDVSGTRGDVDAVAEVSEAQACLGVYRAEVEVRRSQVLAEGTVLDVRLVDALVDTVNGTPKESQEAIEKLREQEVVVVPLAEKLLIDAEEYANAAARLQENQQKFVADCKDNPPG